MRSGLAAGILKPSSTSSPVLRKSTHASLSAAEDAADDAKVNSDYDFSPVFIGKVLVLGQEENEGQESIVSSAEEPLRINLTIVLRITPRVSQALLMFSR